LRLHHSVTPLVVPPRALLSTSSLHQPCIHRRSREIGPTATRHGRCPLTNQLEATSSFQFSRWTRLAAWPAIPGLTLGPSVRDTGNRAIDGRGQACATLPRRTKYCQNRKHQACGQMPCRWNSCWPHAGITRPNYWAGGGREKNVMPVAFWPPTCPVLLPSLAWCFHVSPDFPWLFDRLPPLCTQVACLLMQMRHHYSVSWCSYTNPLPPLPYVSQPAPTRPGCRLANVLTLPGGNFSFFSV
jgi:hypothetical protein